MNKVDFVHMVRGKRERPVKDMSILLIFPTFMFLGGSLSKKGEKKPVLSLYFSVFK